MAWRARVYKALLHILQAAPAAVTAPAAQLASCCKRRRSSSSSSSGLQNILRLVAHYDMLRLPRLDPLLREFYSQEAVLLEGLVSQYGPEPAEHPQRGSDRT